MPESLRYVDDCSQPIVDPRRAIGVRFRMARDEDDRKAFGLRLKAARVAADLTLDGVARRLSDDGYPAVKQTVSAWENGGNLPDPLVLKRLAKMYHQSADALLLESAPSIEAMQFAAQFDALNEKQRRTFQAVWLAFIEQAAGDGEVERKMPATRSLPKTPEKARR